MAAQLDAEIERDIDGVLTAAHDMLTSVQWAYDTYGSIPDHMIAGVQALQDDMIRLLALSEDGALYGKVHHNLTFAMRSFEADACEILELHGKLTS